VLQQWSTAMLLRAYVFEAIVLAVVEPYCA
jgi:hypothetical protein